MNLKLGSDGDLVIGNGFERVDGEALVAQLISCKLRTIKGEWKLNRTIGLPWFTDLLKHNFDLGLIREWIYKTIESITEVISIDKLELAVDSVGRRLIVGFEIKTIYGNIERVVNV